MKRFISLALALIITVAIIPAVLIPAFAADVASYFTVVTADKIELDGLLDEPYKSSRKIVSSYWGTGKSSSLEFVAYTAATNFGLYILAEIKDNSLIKDTAHPAGEGDKFQIYIRMNNGTDNAWGWYDTDYNNNLSKAVKEGTLADAELFAEKAPDGSGWRCELFIPFEGSIEFTDIKKLNVYIGLQANNSTYNGSDTVHTAYCYDKDARSPYYYTATDLYSPLTFIYCNDVLNSDSLEKTAVYVSSSPSIDGVKDAVYGEHSKMVLDCILKDSNYGGEVTRTDLGVVYLVFTKYNLYIYYETEDVDLNANDYFQVYYQIPDGDSYVSGYFCSKIDPSGTRFYGSTGSNYGYPGTAIENSSIDQKKFLKAAKALGNNRYGLEYQIPLTASVKSLIGTGKAEIKIDFSANDYDSTGARKCYGGCTTYSASMYNYNDLGEKLTPVRLERSFNSSAKGIITGANVALGSDITVNYYAMIGETDVFNSCMRFTKNGETYIAYPKKSGYTSEYMFSFEGVAPQTIGDNIKAELIINGEIVATHNNYSVLQNCLNIYDDADNGIKELIKGLLNYGAAAQKYASYKTNSLVNEGFEIGLMSPSASDSIKSTTADISDSLKFVSAGVYFDSVNKIYAKFIATSLSGVTVYVNGAQASIQKVEGEENTYIAYSDGVSVTRFGSEYKFVLSNGSKSQTVRYSVNSYTYSKFESENTATAELAKALYTYGALARDCVGYGNISYKIMTYNDGDNSTTKVDQISAIINQYDPDVVGMQEVQKTHTQWSLSSSTYYSKLSDYKVVYFNKDSNNFDVPVIYYKTSKFDLVSSGIKWLSDTPDTSSKYDESEYLRCFIWAKLKDKTTGETYMFVNTHLDFAQVSLKQTKKLLEIVASLSGGVPVIFTADWNFTRASASAKEMNAAGYYSTESLSESKVKPGSFAGSENVIDFCFVDPDEFRVLDYKVINNHEYSDTASDHYAVYSEIVVTK